MAELKVGDRVTWTWGRGVAEGKVASLSTRKVARTIKGSRITRHGSRRNPALHLEQEDGGRALKLASEVKRV